MHACRLPSAASGHHPGSMAGAPDVAHLLTCCTGAAQGTPDDSPEEATQAREGLPADLQHLLAGAPPSPDRLADSAAGDPDVAHLLLEAAMEANLELARDAETDASMLEVQLMLTMGPDNALAFLQGSHRP